MSNPVPSSVALTTIPSNSSILSGDHRSNYSAIQTAVNALITALGGGAAGQSLQAVDSTHVQWTGGIYKKNSITDVVNTVTPTDVTGAAFTIPAGTLTATSIVHITMWGDSLNNSGGNSNLTFALTIGGQTFYGTTTTALVSASRKGWHLDAWISNRGATNVQDQGGTLALLGLVPILSVVESRANSGTVDTTLAVPITLLVTHGVADANISARCFGGIVQVFA